MVPQTAMRMLELLQEAGLPDGVINLLTCSRKEAELLLSHPDIKGISFIGSKSVGLHIYETAAKNGKRVQALTEAKNHALVMRDCVLERSVLGVINSTFGCAGERCMALPVVVVEDAIADKFVERLKYHAERLKVGPAYNKDSQMGPLVSKGQLKWVTDWIEKGVQEGAKLVLDGRNIKVAGFENGYYMGPTILDNVTAEISFMGLSQHIQAFVLAI